jgi:SPOR domain
MVMLFAVVGLIAGILAGLFNPAGSRQDPTQATSQRHGDESTTTALAALPHEFWTVVLASIPRSRDRSEAEARADDFRDEGVGDVGVLDPEQYPSLRRDYWAVYSGVFDNADDAVQHRDELRESFPDLSRAYHKRVTNQS